jgi:hypothetical protein
MTLGSGDPPRRATSTSGTKDAWGGEGSESNVEGHVRSRNPAGDFKNGDKENCAGIPWGEGRAPPENSKGTARGGGRGLMALTSRATAAGGGHLDKGGRHIVDNLRKMRTRIEGRKRKNHSEKEKK